MNTIIPQIDMFDYITIEEMGDLERIQMCFSSIPMKPLIDKLNADRKNGRNDYSNETMLKLYIVKSICQINTIEKLRRELLRNPVMRRICGLRDEDYRYGKKKLVPNSGVFTLFMKRLEKHQDELDSLFNTLCDDMYELVEGFGAHLAGDGKYLDSYAKNDHHKDSGDDRCEKDAAYSIKEYTFIDKEGKKRTKKETHYGFREHVVVDAMTELPICFVVTAANVDEKKMMKSMMEELNETRRKRAEYIMLDRGYDSKDMLKTIRKIGMKPIVDNRIMRKGDKTIQYKATNIYYTESGECYFLDYGDNEVEAEGINERTGLMNCFRTMRYEGYDKNRNALRYSYQGKVYRIRIDEDPRVFNEVARDSKKFKRLYNERTSVERYNGRLDRDYELEKHTIRGLKKMKVLITFANIIMLALGKLHAILGQSNYASMLNF